MCDPNRPQPPERGSDRFRATRLSRVDEGREAEAPDTRVNALEVAGGEGSFVAAETKAGDPWPGRPLLQVEDPVGRAGPPLTDRVEKDADRSAAAPFVIGEDPLEGVPNGRPRESDLLDHGRGDVDLCVMDPFAVEPADEVAGHFGVIIGTRQTAADVAVEFEETADVTGTGLPGAEGGEVGENGAGRAPRQTDESRRRDASLEVQVKFDLRSRSKPGEKAAAGARKRHDAASYGELPPGVLPPERLWIRAAAYGVDLLLLAGGPLLLSTLAIVAFLLFVADPPASLARGFLAAQGLFAILFLLRDTGGGSPGKKLFGLRLVRDGGRPVGVVASVTRNLPLLVPGWNLIELIAVMRRRDGRRGGDRLAGTMLLES